LDNAAVFFGDPLFNAWPDYRGKHVKLKSVGKQNGHGIKNLHHLGRAVTNTPMILSA